MEDWRRGASYSDWGERQQQLQQHKQQRGRGRGSVGANRSSSNYGRPPLASGSWQPTVPLWEKRFCTNVGLISWGKLCETKRVMSCYKNVVAWDDSAGKEAFENAKARYWAEINGLHCDISLPGPDIYIDDVDWDAETDPQLLLDLDKEPPPPDVEEKNGKVVLLSSDWDRAIPCSGWGDAEDPASPVKDAPAATGWGNWGGNGWDSNNGWGDGAYVDNSGWGVGSSEANSGWGAGAYNNSWGHWENRNNEVDYSESRRSGRKREGGGRCGSRFPTKRYQGDDYYQGCNNNWRNCRGRKGTNYQNVRPALDKQPIAPRHWNSMQSCAPNRQGSAEAGGAWCLKKPIS